MRKVARANDCCKGGCNAVSRLGRKNKFPWTVVLRQMRQEDDNAESPRIIVSINVERAPRAYRCREIFSEERNLDQERSISLKTIGEA